METRGGRETSHSEKRNYGFIDSVSTTRHSSLSADFVFYEIRKSTQLIFMRRSRVRSKKKSNKTWKIRMESKMCSLFVDYCSCWGAHWITRVIKSFFSCFTHCFSLNHSRILKREKSDAGKSVFVWLLDVVIKRVGGFHFNSMWCDDEWLFSWTNKTKFSLFVIELETNNPLMIVWRNSQSERCFLSIHIWSLSIISNIKRKCFFVLILRVWIIFIVSSINEQ